MAGQLCPSQGHRSRQLLVRALLTIGVVLWALTGARDVSLRLYLSALFAAQLVGEAYLFLGTSYDPTYIVTYAVGNLFILLAAAWAAQRVGSPSRLAWAIAGCQAVLGTLLFHSDVQDFGQAVMLASAAGMGAAGALALCARVNTKVMATLSLIWFTQALFFYLYTAGAGNTNVLEWYRIGEWVPALILVLGMLRFGKQVRMVALVGLLLCGTPLLAQEARTPGFTMAEQKARKPFWKSWQYWAGLGAKVAVASIDAESQLYCQRVNPMCAEDNPIFFSRRPSRARLYGVGALTFVGEQALIGFVWSKHEPTGKVLNWASVAIRVPFHLTAARSNYNVYKWPADYPWPAGVKR